MSATNGREKSLCFSQRSKGVNERAKAFSRKDAKYAKESVMGKETKMFKTQELRSFLAILALPVRVRTQTGLE